MLLICSNNATENNPETFISFLYFFFPESVRNYMALCFVNILKNPIMHILLLQLVRLIIQKRWTCCQITFLHLLSMLFTMFICFARWCSLLLNHSACFISELFRYAVLVFWVPSIVIRHKKFCHMKQKKKKIIKNILLEMKTFCEYFILLLLQLKFT